MIYHNLCTPILSLGHYSATKWAFHSESVQYVTIIERSTAIACRAGSNVRRSAYSIHGSRLMFCGDSYKYTAPPDCVLIVAC